MQTFNIVKKSQITNTFRNQYVKDQFSIDKSEIIETFEGFIDLPEKWNIGLIVGNSGTGKTTIAKEIFKLNLNSYIYSNESVIDNMPKEKSNKDIVTMFNQVGFSSPPSWLKSYSVLSNGEKMRVDLARELLTEKDVIVFDEFTSVIDRNIAKIASQAINKTINKLDKKFIAVSCHFDIVEYLQPDWVFDTNKMEFFFIKKMELQKMNIDFLNVTNDYGICLKNITI